MLNIKHYKEILNNISGVFHVKTCVKYKDIIKICLSLVSGAFILEIKIPRRAFAQ